MKVLNSIISKSPAKLNLFLHVLDKRKNNFHSIESIFVPISWCDEVCIESTDDELITREGDVIGNLKDDLLFKSAILLKQYLHSTSKSSNVKIHNYGCKLIVKKNIPYGAGLGGGSSNAALTLKTLNAIWNLNLSNKTLSQIGVKLGADVPFFIQSKSCFVSGIGEKLTQLSDDTFLPKYFVVLIPEIKVSTSEIFESLKLTNYSSTINFQAVNSQQINTLFKSNKKGVWTFGKNDIENTTFKKYPVVKYSMDLLKKYAALHDLPKSACRMSGTGGAVFCSTPDLLIAKKIESSIKINSNEKIQVKVCKRLSFK